MFLIQRDFQKVFNTEDITTILTDSEIKSFEILNEAIDFAVEFIKSKLQHRYDVDNIFIDVNTFDLATAYTADDLIIYSEDAYNEATAYAIDDRVSYQGYIYKALQETTGNAPTGSKTDNAYWEYVTTNYSFYYCTAASTGNYPEDTDYFTAGDSRNKLIKNYSIYLAIDQMFPHINPRVIPEWIIGKKEMATEHLSRISNGKDTVILPTKTTTTTPGDENDIGARFTYGSTDTQRTIDY